MPFRYENGLQTSLTPPGLQLYCKSFKIDIAGGSAFTTATVYPLGLLPARSQIIDGNVLTVTPVSGGTVSAATIIVRSNTISLGGAANVFAVTSTTLGPTTYFSNKVWEQTTDQLITYTPTLTGADATVGIVYVNIFYVA